MMCYLFSMITVLLICYLFWMTTLLMMFYLCPGGCWCLCTSPSQSSSCFLCNKRQLGSHSICISIFPSRYSSGGESLSDIFFYRTQVRSLPCIIPSEFLLFLRPMLLHGFVKIDTWISKSCHMDLLKLLHMFVKNVTLICKSSSMKFLRFAKQNQAEV